MEEGIVFLWFLRFYVYRIFISSLKYYGNIIYKMFMLCKKNVRIYKAYL